MKHIRVFCVSLALFIVCGMPAAVLSQRKPSPKPRPAPDKIVRITKLGSVDVLGGDTPPNLSAAQKLRWDSFIKVWETLRDNYFDQTFNGLDWNAVKAEYRPRVVAAKNDLEFHQQMQEMIGRLERSHFAIVPPEVYREIETAKAEAKKREKERAAGARSTAGDDDDDDDNSPFETAETQFGIGVELRLIDGKFVISGLDRDSAAEYAGVKPGYILDKINGVSLSEMVSRITAYYSSLGTEKFLKYLPIQIGPWFLNGEKDSYVTITCLDGDNKAVDFRIRREPLRGRNVVLGENLPDQYLKFVTRDIDPDIGYLRFNVFAKDVVDAFCDAIRRNAAKKALIVDLRGNTGGLLGPLYALSGMLTDDKIDIGTMIYKVGREPMIARSMKNNFKGKLVFLVDRYTISAAEIFAGAVQDNKRALIIGEKTAGEALPAISVVLPTGGVMLYPIANFKTKTGRLLEGVGVVPDVPVTVDRKMLLDGSDPQLARAIAEIKQDKLFPQSKPEPDADLPPPPTALPPAPKPAPKVVTLTGAPAGTGSGISTVAPPPPMAVGTGAAPKPPSEVKDEKALAVIKAFADAAGSLTDWRAIKTYTITGRQQIGYRGSQTTFSLRSYKRYPSDYAIILTTPAVGEVRTIVSGRQMITQSEYGLENTVTLPEATNVDLFDSIFSALDTGTMRSVAYTGIFDRDGRKCHIIEATLKDGVSYAMAFDVESKMLVSIAGRYSLTSYGDYRKVGRLMMPFKVDVGSGKALEFDTIVLDEALGDDLFKRKENCYDRPAQ
ncbi:MAG: hypothetical protein K1X36_13985 [Pyrinomonadaceae bacterium]|nr:hypothetical protein [Pyrinomonadaceae bacterium]